MKMVLHVDQSGTATLETGADLLAEYDVEALQLLAKTLGCNVASEHVAYTSYVAQILAHWPGRAPKSQFVDLFVKVVEFFSGMRFPTRHMHRNTFTLLTERAGHVAEKAPSIQSCIDQFIQGDHGYFRDGLPPGDGRVRTVTSTILIILGAWTLMPQYFVPTPRGDCTRHIIHAYCRAHGHEYDEAFALGQKLNVLLTGSGLLPNSSERYSSGLCPADDSPTSTSLPPEDFQLHMIEDVESLSIDPVDLNAYKLLSLGGLRIRWTVNISRHLLITSYCGIAYLELFALPSAIDDGTGAVLASTGVPVDVMLDIKNSYAGLFNPTRPSTYHQLLKPILAMEYWCWCQGCSSHRLRLREFRKLRAGKGKARHHDTLISVPKFDPLLVTLAQQKSNTWDPAEFPTLWPRILALNKHMNQSKPWNFLVLFRDNRDTLQYWTFLYVGF
jgi:hypothetical protein